MFGQADCESPIGARLVDGLLSLRKQTLHDGEEMRQEKSARRDHHYTEDFHNCVHSTLNKPEVLHRMVGCVPARRTLGAVFDNSMPKLRNACD